MRTCNLPIANPALYHTATSAPYTANSATDSLLGTTDTLCSTDFNSGITAMAEFSAQLQIAFSYKFCDTRHSQEGYVIVSVSLSVCLFTKYGISSRFLNVFPRLVTQVVTK